MIEKINNYPVKFELDGEIIELNKSMMRKINKKGAEEKCSFEGKIIGYSLFPNINEFVILFEYPTGYFCLSKKYGWFGPYKEVTNIYADKDNQISYIEGKFNLIREN